LVVEIQNEYQKLETLNKNFGKLAALMSTNIVNQKSNAKTFTTCLGGFLYLPNVQGIKGAGKRENLVLVDEEKELYYGFGSFFKEGPKTLKEIAEKLSQWDSELYNSTIKDLANSGMVKLNDANCHPLQFLIQPETCLVLDINKIKDASSSLPSKPTCAFCKKDNKLMQCAGCKSIGYCSKECQRNDWGVHKHNCKKK
jgi:hypothetical protein